MDQNDLQDLLQAARKNDLLTLNVLLADDSQILDKSDLLVTPEDTPLHVATLSGKTKFAAAVLRQTPCLAWNQNKAGLSPLHIASALGHLDIARALLKLGPELCLLQDQKGLTPLHHAAIKGEVHIIEELLSKCPQVLFKVTSQQDSAFHLAVRHQQVEALEALLRRLTDSRKMNRMINIARNRHGFTVSQLAESTGPDKALALLKGRDEQEAMEIVHVDQQVQPNISGTDHTITSVGTQTREKEEEQWQQRARHMQARCRKLFFFFVAIFRSSPFNQSASQVVAGLLLQVTYQALLTPPPTIWKEDWKLDYQCLKYAFGFLKIKNVHRPPSCPTQSFIGFMALNTVGFASSLALVLFIKRGYWLYHMLATSLYALLGGYMFLLSAVIPGSVASLVIVLYAIPPLVLPAVRAPLAFMLGFAAGRVVKKLRTIIGLFRDQCKLLFERVKLKKIIV